MPPTLHAARSHHPFLAPSSCSSDSCLDLSVASGATHLWTFACQALLLALQGGQHLRPRTYHLYPFFFEKCAAIYGRNMVFPEKVTSLTHNTCMCMTNVKDAAKVNPPKHCPDLHGVPLSPISRTFYHPQAPNKNRVQKQTVHRIGVQIIRPTKEALCSHLQPHQGCKKNRQMFLLTREKSG